MDRAVILTCTPDQPRYFVPALFSAMLWRWAGWEPHVYLYLGRPGRGWDDALPAYCRMAMMEDAAVAFHFRGPWPVPEWSQHPVFHRATASRRCAAALDFPPETYVVLGDADMLLCDDTYLQPEPGVLQVWGHDLYHTRTDRPERWPACYQGAQASVWREIMQPTSDDADEAGRQHMEDTRREAIAIYGKWDCEPGFHVQLSLSGFPRGRIRLLGRKHPATYSRRLYVREPLLPRDPIDCHIRGDWYGDERWRLFLDNTPRIPDDLKARMSGHRQAILGLLGDWKQQAEEQGNA